jgi:hypothetical protein
MKRSLTGFLAAISVATCLLRGAIAEDKFNPYSQGVDPGATIQRLDNGVVAAIPSHRSFYDHTVQIVGEALNLINRNEHEGASLDQRWYAFRRFGKHLDQVLGARAVRFYGGREPDVLRFIADQYLSVSPLEPDQDPGDMRFFMARRDAESWDLVIIGHNGREVALKMVIRLAYFFKFMDESYKRAYVGGFDSFLHKVKIYLSTTPARQEFISFFQLYGISDADAVIIGFQRDARAVLKESGIGCPERHSNDSLKINWYANANGNKVLLVSINGNRIFASRAGELIKAIFETFRSPPRTLIFLGSAGAVASDQLVGQIVAPTVVVANDYFDPNQHGGKLAHIIRNHAAMIVPVKTAHTSVENMVVETLNWATVNSQRRIMTVDQELYHLINAVNTSPHASNIKIFVGLFVSDNVSAIGEPYGATLQHAEDVIARTATVRREFLGEVLVEAGIIPHRSATVPETFDCLPVSAAGIAVSGD